MLIVGAGGHAKEVLDVLLFNYSDSVFSFFDNTPNAPTKVHNIYSVVHNIEGVLECFKIDNRFCLGVGEPKLRQQFLEQFLKLGGRLVNIRTSNSIMSNYSSIEGDIMQQVFIGSNVHIGKGALLNYGAQAHHDVKVGVYAEVSPNAILLGKSTVGNFSRIGANAVILPNMNIGENSVIGAGAVVTGHIPENAIAVGVPAKVIKNIY